MDLRTAVAASMLPASRALVAARFKDLSSNTSAGSSSAEILSAILRTLKAPPPDLPAAISAAIEAADDALRCAAALGMTALSLGDRRYPVMLACTSDPPPVLWTVGDPGVLHDATVAVVGSRAATPYALQVGERLGSELAAKGLVVASGLARGVDSAAHRGCLSADGRTVAVLGSGLDRIYPAEHQALAADIIKKGCLVSELGPGAPPLQEHFPLRNRIISGISLAVVVVEASEKSGSLITARYALEQGRDVMAVPGSVLTGRNRGSHGLLKDGAKVVESGDDILDGLGWPGQVRPSAAVANLLDTDPLLGRMDPGEVYHLDELIEMTGLTGSRLLTRLTELELLGLVTAAGMGRFGRVVT